MRCSRSSADLPDVTLLSALPAISAAVVRHDDQVPGVCRGALVEADLDTIRGATKRA